MKHIVTKWFVFAGLVGAILGILSFLVIPVFGSEEKKSVDQKNQTYNGDGTIENEPDDANKKAIYQLAEGERSKGFSPGMGLSESTLYEKSGDLAGAVLSAFKEIFFAYQYGYLTTKDLEGRLKAVEQQFPENQQVITSLNVCRAFLSGSGKKGLEALTHINLNKYEIDAFPRWLERVFLLSTGKNEQKVFEAYLALRSRYSNYPYYWLVAARYSLGTQQIDAAERCVSLAPQGPFAEEGRSLLAQAVGLTKKDAPALRTRMEIETLITTTIQTGRIEGLKDLFPLLALPDNPYTLYALGACRGLAENKDIVTFFEQEQKRASGRLAERLRYISGGRS
ncbi:hypothetical protein [Gracilinema caldarium]|uniref:hypothetical protein n=1 Tax=Gracilinema caldarium TaxID=215591 RepID=UPI0002D52E91|nr:hypothetical protein [Gracilinema caldarium]